MTSKLFTDLGLSPEMLKAIDRLGFEQAAPIQAEAIPLLLQGIDVIGQSQTGSGKTAAFSIPAIERIDPTKPGPQVLVLCPTRELAVQVSEEIHKLVFFKRGIRALPIYGGQSYERQFAGLRAGVQIVIGTPGRVMDHLERGTLKLDHVRTVILDEADEMLDMGFRDDIEFILQRVPVEGRQTVLFSATIPRPIEELIQRYTKNPRRVKIEAKALTVPTVEQVYYEVDRRWKFEALTRLIELHDIKLGIVFCNTQRMVDELTEHLNAGGYSADAIHGGMAQAGRDRVMGRFRSGGLEFLVATDVAARGIDVEGIEVVFNYDLPYDAEDYVHRIGRTGRAGRTGLAMSFVSGREIFAIRQIENYTRHRMRRGRVPSEPEVEEAKVNQLLSRVRSTLTAGDYRHYDHFIEALLEEGFDSTDLLNALFHRLTLGDPEPETPEKARVQASWPTQVPASNSSATPASASAPASSAPTAAPVPRPVRPKPQSAPGFQGTAIEPGARTAERPVPPRPADRPATARPLPTSPGPKRNVPTPGAFGNRKTEVSPTPSKPSPRPVKAPAPASAPVDDEGYPIPAKPAAATPKRPAPASVPGALPPEVSSTPPPPPPPPTLVPLWVNAGSSHGVASPAIVSCIQGETGLPASVIGKVTVHEDHSEVEVAEQHARSIISRLNRAHFQGRRLRAKLA
jgi:ATP-dependent RNA helicase DeaD